jgi:hydroxymethylglutaryl-CoA lyase
MSEPSARDVVLTEVALRDGLQSEDKIVPTADKLRLAARLVAAGIRELEVGSFVNPERVPQMADTGELLPQVAALKGVTPIALVFNRRGAERAITAGATTARLVVSVSDEHSKSNAGVGTHEALDRLQESVTLLRENGLGCEGNIATAFVCPFEGDIAPDRVLAVIRRLLDMGVDAISVADTIGAANPGQVRRLLELMNQELSDIPLGIHLHNTYGMAAANAYVALGQGVRRFDASLGGIGGCPFAPGASGNVATDDMVHFFHREGLQTGIDVDQLAACRKDLAQAIGHPLSSALSLIPATPVAVATA